MYEIYTDGAYSPSRNQGGIGLVFVKDGKLIGTYREKYLNTTNNRMELYAIIIALKSFKNPVDAITIYSDSQYVLNTIAGKFNKKANLDLWQEFEKIEDYVNTNICINGVNYRWIKGHSDNEFNNKADELAVKASQEL